MTKKVAMAQPRPVQAMDDFVKQKPAAKPAEKTKRLTLDIPASLHTRVKTYCAANEQKMTDAVRAWIEAGVGGRAA